MRFLTPTAVVMAALAGAPQGAAAQDRPPPCHGDPDCRQDYPLRIAPAAVPGVPLVWSRALGRLVPPPVGREPILLGRTIPLDELIGRRVHSLLRPPAPVVYNMPPADLDPADPSLVLIRLGRPARRGPLRRAD